MILNRTTPLLRLYFTKQQEYEKKYGSNTVVLMEIGSFYEIYEVDEYSLGKAKQVGDILNIQITRKNKSKPVSLKNPYMIGFPSYAIKKYINKLINNDFIVAKFDQRDVQGSDTKERVLDKVYSPGTYIENENNRSNYIMAILVEEIDELKQVYVSSIDLSTGSVKVFETHDQKDNCDKADDNLFRYIHSINPIEILFLGKENKDLIDRYGLSEKIVHFREIVQDYRKVSYQTQLLTKIYGNTSITPIEYIGLETQPDLLLTYVCLLQFTFEHDPSIVTRINIPDIDTNNEIMILNKDSIYQLNIVNKKYWTGDRYSSLFNLINFTKTSMGKRLLKERLLQPITDVKKLNKRYDYVEKFKTKYEKYDEILKEIIDLEKKHRKAIVKKLSPHELFGMISSYINIITLLHKAKDDIKIKGTVIKKFSTFFDTLKNTLLFEKLEGVYSVENIKYSLFQVGLFEEIDSKQKEINEVTKYFDTLSKELSDIVDKRKPNTVRVEYNEIYGYHLVTTKKRYEKIEEIGSYSFDTRMTKNSVTITSSKIKEKSSERKIAETEINKIIKNIYENFLYKIFLKYRKVLQYVTSYVSEIDVLCSSAKASLKYGYIRPQIVEQEKGFCSFKGIRHPLIEQIIESEYIVNDISIGKENNGAVLYGLNAIGKSSLLKSIGVNIILAQAGMFVACSELQFSPYNLLFSKIVSKDNIFMGQSTFVSEMCELRSILKNSDCNSLILADELCSGTESLSATSILASTLIELNKRDTSFIFSTHLHDLMDIKEIKKLEGNNSINIYHFTIEYKDSKIVYKRKLEKGNGESVYGLEVAKHSNLGLDFIRKTFEIRAELEGKNYAILSTKKSKYNSSLYVHECHSCGKEMTDLHTHHIIPQKEADENGLIEGRIQKDKLFNLEVLCKDCHIKHHQEHGYK